jgi:predicted  nucleic acid-binding Zn ribbon protein
MQPDQSAQFSVLTNDGIDQVRKLIHPGHDLLPLPLYLILGHRPKDQRQTVNVGLVEWQRVQAVIFE